MIKVKIEVLENQLCMDALMNLYSQRIKKPSKLAYDIRVIVKKITAAMEAFTDMKQDFIMTYGTDVPDKPGVKQIGVNNEHFIEYHELIDPLMEQEVELEITPLKLESVMEAVGFDNQPIAISALDMDALDWLWEKTKEGIDPTKEDKDG